MNPHYTDYSEYMQGIFPGMKVQKLSIDAGFTCPNRDGTIGRGGCIYCDNSSFTPRYCSPTDSVRIQIEKGKAFFGRKYPEMKYLAYFQSYTNTFGKGTTELTRLYEEAAGTDEVVGIVIGTRPDCLPAQLLDSLEAINRRRPVFVEIGAETSFDTTLRLINRNHTWSDVTNSVMALSERGIRTGLHLIAGLPGETSEDVLTTIDRACLLPIDSLKLHQLQVIRGTRLHRMWEAGEIEVKPYRLEEYLDLCSAIVRSVPRHICIERFLASSPPEMVVAPKWGLKNYQFTNLLMKLLSC